MLHSGIVIAVYPYAANVVRINECHLCLDSHHIMMEA